MSGDDLRFVEDKTSLSERLHELARRKVTLQQSYAALSRDLESLRQTLSAEDWLRLDAPL